jgi:hypothetical protein
LADQGNEGNPVFGPYALTVELQEFLEISIRMSGLSLELTNEVRAVIEEELLDDEG